MGYYNIYNNIYTPSIYNIYNNIYPVSPVQCLRVVEQDDEAHYAKLVTRVVAGCDHMFKCLRMFRRTENIMEIQVGVTMMVEWWWW